MPNLAKAAAQLRVARPTDRLAALEAFYGDGLGLEEVGRFSDHAGYDGVILGMPDRSVQLEFTQREGTGPCPAPSRDNLLVFYVRTRRPASAPRPGSAGSAARPCPRRTPTGGRSAPSPSRIPTAGGS